MTQRINIKADGPAYDLEAFYIRNPTALLPDPEGLIPFGRQGAPIPDIYQKHVSYKEQAQMVGEHSTNPLPTKYWTGTSIRQVNAGGPSFYLGVNEDRKR